MFFFSLSLPRKHAEKQADEASHEHSHALVHAHSITGMYYKYTLQCRRLIFASAALGECCPSINRGRLCIHSWFMTCSSASLSGWPELMHDSKVTECMSLLISHNQLTPSFCQAELYLYLLQANAAVKSPQFENK